MLRRQAYRLPIKYKLGYLPGLKDLINQSCGSRYKCGKQADYYVVELQVTIVTSA